MYWSPVVNILQCVKSVLYKSAEPADEAKTVMLTQSNIWSSVYCKIRDKDVCMQMYSCAGQVYL